MKPDPEKPLRLTRKELGIYIVADIVDHLTEMETSVRSLKRHAQNALAALNKERRQDMALAENKDDAP